MLFVLVCVIAGVLTVVVDALIECGFSTQFSVDSNEFVVDHLLPLFQLDTFRILVIWVTCCIICCVIDLKWSFWMISFLT